jgi:hypothetical protein
MGFIPSSDPREDTLIGGIKSGGKGVQRILEVLKQAFPEVIQLTGNPSEPAMTHQHSNKGLA